MRVFTLTVFTEQFTHVTVLAENGPLDCGEDCPRQNCAQVLPVLKGQGGQVNLVAHLHPHGTFGSSDHLPWAIFNIQVIDSAMSGEVGMCEFLRSQYSQNSSHM